MIDWLFFIILLVRKFLMDEINIRRIINETRLRARNICLSAAELAFVFQTDILKPMEKLLWFYIASRTAYDRALCARLNEKDMRAVIGVGESDDFFFVLQGLKLKGFLNLYEEPGLGRFYALLLPEEGLEVLEEAPKLCDGELKKKGGHDDS